MSGHVYTIFDTHVLLKALGNVEPHRSALEHLKQRNHIMRYSTEIRHEYICETTRLGMTRSILERKLEELEKLGKFKKINRTALEQAQRIISKRRCKLPPQKDDVKFVVAALASKAKYVITTDHGWLSLNPYRCANENFEFIGPQDYQIT